MAVDRDRSALPVNGNPTYAVEAEAARSKLGLTAAACICVRNEAAGDLISGCHMHDDGPCRSAG